jgi:hypothetical protein
MRVSQIVPEGCARLPCHMLSMDIVATHHTVLGISILPDLATVRSCCNGLTVTLEPSCERSVKLNACLGQIVPAEMGRRRGVSIALNPCHVPCGTVGTAWGADGTSAPAPETIIASQSTFLVAHQAGVCSIVRSSSRPYKSATGPDIKHLIRRLGPPGASDISINTCRCAQPIPHFIITF